MDNFSRGVKNQLFHANALALRLATELGNNGFVDDAPYELKKLTPLNSIERVNVLLVGFLPALKAKLLDKSRSAAGMDEGEVICLAMACALDGFLNCLAASENDPGDHEIAKLGFVTEKTEDRFALLEIE